MFTGLWFDYVAELHWFFGWYVKVYQYGEYDYSKGYEKKCRIRKKKYLFSLKCKNRFRALLLQARINKQQLELYHCKENFTIVMQRKKYAKTSRNNSM